MFDRTSRYADVETAVHVDARGREIPYKRLRFLGTPRTLRVHEVAAGDRLDRIAHEHLGDPERFWLVADANRVLQPAELVREVGRPVQIPMAGG